MASEGGSAGRDFFIVIALLVALGIAWYYTGGPERSISRSGPLLSQPGIGGGQAYTVPRVARNRATSTSSSNGPSGTSWGTFTNYLGTFTEDRSPYASYVTLERGRSDGPLADEYVRIRVSPSAPNKITISDWKLESTMSQLRVPLGGASYLPYTGQVNSEQTVAVGAGASVYVVTARSPIGVSFRVNECTGYFEQFQTFAPKLKLECPRPEDEADRVLGTYNEACEDFVGSINRCTVTLNAIPGAVGSACQNFIQNDLTYNSCVSAHQSDPKFYKDEWYIFLKRDQELWRDRNERIRLVDESGKVVGVVSY